MADPLKVTYYLATDGNDPELDAIGLCIQAFDSLDDWLNDADGPACDSISRVLRYLTARYEGKP